MARAPRRRAAGATVPERGWAGYGCAGCSSFSAVSSKSSSACFVHFSMLSAVCFCAREGGTRES